MSQVRYIFDENLNPIKKTNKELDEEYNDYDDAISVNSSDSDSYSDSSYTDLSTISNDEYYSSCESEDIDVQNEFQTLCVVYASLRIKVDPSLNKLTINADIVNRFINKDGTANEDDLRTEIGILMDNQEESKDYKLRCICKDKLDLYDYKLKAIESKFGKYTIKSNEIISDLYKKVYVMTNYNNKHLKNMERSCCGKVVSFILNLCLLFVIIIFLMFVVSNKYLY